MRVYILLQLILVTKGSVIIVPDDYIWRDIESSWFDARATDMTYSSHSCGFNRAFSADSLLDLTSVPSIDDQRNKLMAIFDALDGGNWKRNDNWGIGEPCFQGWFGLVCDCDGNVVRISLVDNALSGSIPIELGQITHQLYI